MDKLYYRDTYLRELDCTVVQVTRTDKTTEVLTDRTIFYPESGGQPGDRGSSGRLTFWIPGKPLTGIRY